ncbi:MAG: ParB/RepB/Spo0J family partition protein [Capsulimonadaceae bacterium]|nr:ParB/RepB/Spo0J family partition protein [Capsulimonadaceae bacterium]
MAGRKSKSAVIETEEGPSPQPSPIGMGEGVAEMAVKASVGPSMARLADGPSVATAADGRPLAEGDDRTFGGWAQGSAEQEIPVVRIHASSFNPRKAFDEAKTVSLAASMGKHGLLSPIILRPSEEAEGDFEIVAGERRFRAALTLGWNAIRAIVREAGDLAAEEIAIIENVMRENLNAVEEAEAYRRLREIHGLKVEEIAERVGRSRSAVSNAMRLPEGVRALVASGELSEAHGRAIVRWAPFEPIMSELARIVIDDKLSSKSIEGELNSQLTHALEQGGAIRSLDGYHRDFDTNICRECPFDAMRNLREPTDWSANRYCLRPDHFAELVAMKQNEERIKAEEQAAKHGESAAKQIEKKRASVDKAVTAVHAANTAPERKAAERELAAAMKAIELVAPGVCGEDGAPIPAEAIGKDSDAASPALPDIHGMKQGSYIDIWSEGQRPKGCSPNCPCNVKARAAGQVRTICCDPGRWRSLSSMAKREATKRRKEAIEKNLARASKVVWMSGYSEMASRRVIAMLVARLVSSVGLDTRRAALEALVMERPKIEIGALSPLDTAKDIYRDADAECFRKAFMTLPPDTALAYAAECLVAVEIRNAGDSKDMRTPLMDWLIGRLLESGESAEAVVSRGTGAGSDQEPETYVAAADARPETYLPTSGPLPPETGGDPEGEDADDDSMDADGLSDGGLEAREWIECHGVPGSYHGDLRVGDRVLFDEPMLPEGDRIGVLICVGSPESIVKFDTTGNSASWPNERLSKVAESAGVGEAK